MYLILSDLTSHGLQLNWSQIHSSVIDCHRVQYKFFFLSHLLMQLLHFVRFACYACQILFVASWIKMGNRATATHAVAVVRFIKPRWSSGNRLCVTFLFTAHFFPLQSPFICANNIISATMCSACIWKALERVFGSHSFWFWFLFCIYF